MTDVNDKRPKNIDFTTLKLPLPAITSIIHRISGGFVFVGIAFLLYLLDQSLQSPQGFAAVGELIANPLGKIVVWLVLSALAYHFIAGIKHLILDMGIGETLAGGVLASKLIIGFSALAIIAVGIWLW